MWSGGGVINLGGLTGSTGSYADAINNAGQVVGASDFGNGGALSSHATLWSGGRVIDLGVLPGDTGSVGIAINNSGQAVGYSAVSGANGSVIDNATLWSGGVITNLGALPGSITSSADAINDAGEIVGASYNAQTKTWHATLWNDGSVIDLNSVVGSSLAGWTLESATGQIAGYGLNPSGQFDAFLLTPVLQPPTISGTAANQAPFTLHPFGNVVITDPNLDQTETVTVTRVENAGGPVSNAVLYGILYDRNAAVDGSHNANGVYTVTGSPTAVTADLEGLVRSPGLETTNYTIHVTDTAGLSATNTTTSIIGVLNYHPFV